MSPGTITRCNLVGRQDQAHHTLKCENPIALVPGPIRVFQQEKRVDGLPADDLLYGAERLLCHAAVTPPAQDLIVLLSDSTPAFAGVQREIGKNTHEVCKPTPWAMKARIPRCRKN